MIDQGALSHHPNEKHAHQCAAAAAINTRHKQGLGLGHELQKPKPLNPIGARFPRV
jgi:hypothetical protein